jgi:hypothetical protein
MYLKEKVSKDGRWMEFKIGYNGGFVISDVEASGPSTMVIVTYS